MTHVRITEWQVATWWLISHRRSQTPPNPYTCHTTIVYGREKCLALVKEFRPDLIGAGASGIRSWNEAYAAHWNAVATTLDVPAAEDGRPLEWVMAQPTQLMQTVVGESPELQECYAEALRDDPCSADRPWKAVIGFDEFAPGKIQHGQIHICLLTIYSG